MGTSFILNCPSTRLTLDLHEEKMELRHSGNRFSTRVTCSETMNTTRCMQHPWWKNGAFGNWCSKTASLLLKCWWINPTILYSLDIQMPILSGIGAAEIYRYKLSEPLRSVPIIAMTANAIKGRSGELYRGWNGRLYSQTVRSATKIIKVANLLWITVKVWLCSLLWRFKTGWWFYPIQNLWWIYPSSKMSRMGTKYLSWIW